MENEEIKVKTAMIVRGCDMWIKTKGKKMEMNQNSVCVCACSRVCIWFSFVCSSEM